MAALLILVVLVDVVVAYHLRQSGWPKRIDLTSGTGLTEVVVSPTPFSATDWVILAGTLIVHLGLCYSTWSAWRRR